MICSANYLNVMRNNRNINIQLDKEWLIIALHRKKAINYIYNELTHYTNVARWQLNYIR